MIKGEKKELKKSKKYVVILGPLFIIMILLINKFYFFNPILFKEDYITNLPWADYRNPLVIEYAYTDFRTGWKVNEDGNQKEIRYIMQELKKSEVLHNYNNNMYPYSNDELKKILIHAYSNKIITKQITVLDLFVLEEDKLGYVSTSHTYIKLSDNLLKLLVNRINEAKLN